MIGSFFKKLVRRVVPEAGTPEHDAAQLTHMFKPYINWDFVNRFNISCQSGMNADLFTDIAPFKLVPLSVAPLIASYECRWGRDERSKGMMVMAIISTGGPFREMEQWWGGINYLDYMEAAIDLICSLRQGKSLEEFMAAATAEDSPLVDWYLHACVHPELGPQLAADSPVRRFAMIHLESALGLVRSREPFCSPYPRSGA